MQSRYHARRSLPPGPNPVSVPCKAAPRHASKCLLTAIVALAMGLPASLAASGLELSGPERAAFGAEIRALLRAEPEILARSLSRELNQDLTDEIAGDTALLARHAAAIFADPADRRIGLGARSDDPATIAAFLDPTDPGTRAALMELEDLARGQPGLVIAVKEVTPESTAAALAATLGLDLLPSYVLADRMIRGDVPPALLMRYLPARGH